MDTACITPLRKARNFRSAGRIACLLHLDVGLLRLQTGVHLQMVQTSGGLEACNCHFDSSVVRDA